jgi:hypothetical protein
MADQSQVLDVVFPYKGVNQAVAYMKQPPITTHLMKNMRVKDVSEQRARGGQRPGTKKVSTDQIGSTKPVLKIVQVATTYIPVA